MATEVDKDPEQVAIAAEQAYMEETFKAAEDMLEPLLDSDYDTKTSQLTPMEKAKYDLALIYSLNSYYWMYLRSLGVDTKTHGIMEELQRIKKVTDRIKGMTERKAPRNMKIDAKAAHRMVKHELWEPPRNSSKRTIAQGVASEDNWDNESANKDSDVIEIDN